MQDLTFPRLLAAAVLAVTLGGTALAEDFKAGAIVVAQPWTRATPAGASVAGGYMTITNNGTDPDHLVGGSFEAAGKMEIHEMTMEGGIMRMRPLPNGLEIKPGQTVTLEPSGNHVMFVGLKQQLKQGASVKGELRFDKAGTVEVDYKVEPVGASKPTPSGHSH